MTKSERYKARKKSMAGQRAAAAARRAAGYRPGPSPFKLSLLGLPLSITSAVLAGVLTPAEARRV